MAQQKIVWTALPNGRITEGELAGRWCVSLVASPRLTPEDAGEQILKAFEAWLRWPETLAGLRLGLQIGSEKMALEPLPPGLPDAGLWARLFGPETPVAGFEFKDMSRVNLRSFPVRNVLGFARSQYGKLAAEAGSAHPVLLPWRRGSSLDGFLGALGTQVDERPRLGKELKPGFSRFHPAYVHGKDIVLPSGVDTQVDGQVFGATSCIFAPQIPLGGEPGAQSGTFALHALPPDWENPALIAVGGPGGAQRQLLMDNFQNANEYSFYQADRFYRRRTPTLEEIKKRRPDYKNVDPALQPPELDFHAIVSSFGDYPALLRALGLVIDCVLPKGTALDAVTDAGSLSGRMLPLVKGPDAALVHACLQTAWQAWPRRFVTAPRTADHKAGLLAMGGAHDRHDEKQPNGFDVYQVDPDGTALKTVDYLLTAQNLIGKSFVTGADGMVTYTTGDAQPVAALRSAGLGVSRHGRAGVVAIDARASGLKNEAIEASTEAAARVVLYTEDVLRGYRVDVQPRSTGRWLSLCERVGRYRLLQDGQALDLPGESEADEGYVKSASTTSNGADDNHYLHESLFRWAGWSLVAPRPGRSLLAENDAGMQTETMATPGEDEGVPAVVEKGNGLDVRFTARKGSLPRLRFGELYRFRARLVDLAGNSLAREDRDVGKDEQATDGVQFARFEPIGPPVLVQQDRLSEGESLERMVIRSNFDAAADSYLQGAGVSAFYTVPPGGTALPDFAYNPVNLRHVVPPKAAQMLCEQHGCLDAAMSGDAGAIKQAYAIGARESGSLMDARPDAEVELVTPQSKAGIATVGAPGELILPPDQADATRDRFAAGQYIIHREALVPVPYLPDPASGGLALHGVPGLARLLEGKAVEALAPGVVGVVLDRGVRAARVLVDDPALMDPDVPNERFRWVLLIDFDTDPQPGDKGWPDDRRSLCIALHDQPPEVATPSCGVPHTLAEPPKWDEGKRTLHLFLPQGRIARLLYASFAHDVYLGHLGLAQWVANPGAADQLRAAALTGASWMVTPFRRLVLVHATQQPVCVPVLAHAFPARPMGATYADLFGKHDNIVLHGPSTGKFEVMAEWSEWIDDPERDDPANPGPFRQPCKGALGEIRLAENHPNSFAIEQAVADQRRYDEGAGQTTEAQLARRANAPGNRHEFGDTRFRWVRYHLRAVTRFREYLPPDLYAQADLVTREGEPLMQSSLRVITQGGVSIDADAGAPMLPQGADPQARFGLIVPASAAPDAPRVVYTLPTFRWTRAPASADGVQTSLREGNALRVYLDRPWFSSGDGELLAVVVAPVRSGRATPFSGITLALSDRVTQWGLDPLWESSRPSVDAEPGDFPLSVVNDNLQLADGGGLVTVVAHRVQWSPARKLWYCDIEISTGSSYMPFVRLALARYQPNALPDAQLSPIVLADFAQVLPRRRAVLTRADGRVTASLRGPVPTRGPMRDKLREGLPTESPYADISFQPVPGAATEMGENRVELVLQQQDPAIDSDLAWRDVSTLAAGPAIPSSGLVLTPRAINVGDGMVVRADTDTVPVALRSGQQVRFDRAETLNAAGVNDQVLVNIPPLVAVPEAHLPIFDQPFWEMSATLPATANAPTRLVLREFERYYTDRTVPEQRAGATRRRRVIEERLVYSEFFEV